MLLTLPLQFAKYWLPVAAHAPATLLGSQPCGSVITHRVNSSGTVSALDLTDYLQTHVIASAPPFRHVRDMYLGAVWQVLWWQPPCQELGLACACHKDNNLLSAPLRASPSS